MQPAESPLPFANRFELDEPIGSGGMGTVFRARDLLTGEWVAVKLLRNEHASSAEVERFMREAQLLAELQHPGIVRYVTHGVSEGRQPYLAMEWLDGEDLSQRLRRRPLTIPDSRTLLRQVAAALACAHQLGIVHRDLKPSGVAPGA